MVLKILSVLLMYPSTEESYPWGILSNHLLMNSSISPLLLAVAGMGSDLGGLANCLPGKEHGGGLSGSHSPGSCLRASNLYPLWQEHHS